MLCCGYTLTGFPISIRLTSMALWQSNDCPNASKATLMNMDKYFMWIHYERLHNHNKAKHNKTVCIFLGIYCSSSNTLSICRSANFDYIFQLIVHFPKPQCKSIIIQITIYYGHDVLNSTYDNQPNLWGRPFRQFNVFKNNIEKCLCIDNVWMSLFHILKRWFGR